jgi:acetyltransferase-like isoleucine patch superfamily enzyme
MARDPRQARMLTLDSLRWVIRNRAWNWWYLTRYWRYFWFRVFNRHVVTEGFVFFGKRCEISVRKGYGRLIIGRWVHFGDENRIRVHEGSMRIGDKVVFGRDNTVNCYLDIEIGSKCLVADWVYICDFDHVYDDLTIAIKDQGIAKSPVRIGADTWIGVKATVLRGTTVGTGSVLAAHTVARGDIAPRSVVGGVPGRVLKNREEVSVAKEATRLALADIARKTAAAVESAESVGRSAK